MPLRARLDVIDIFAFNFDSESWEALRARSVTMHCCDSRSILKTSKLGTKFFAHYRKGDCAYGDESAEHIYIKNLISITAKRLGWRVETEMNGETPSGEKWTADVYCIKGNAKLAFEVQWSYQARDEFTRRQIKYISSGIRCAWLYRIKGKRLHFVEDIPYEYETPVFGMKSRSKEFKELYIPQFNEPFETFIEGMLQGELMWSPKKGDQLIAEVIPHYENCWKCKKETGVILGISIKSANGTMLGFHKFSDEGIPEFMLQNGVSEHLSKFRVGKLKTRYSKTAGAGYISNGCYNCGVLMGNHYLIRSLLNYYDGYPDPIYTFSFIHGQNGPLTESEWYFKNRKSSHAF